ncbi:nucleotidyl transferase AbiEii/AbiGii toxin family protein [Candidatus Saganbacteria bacterium]|nr:nucleotidyl transferase AbiEii/AbiGii toxin family protein [Candidatus Saganbacteria bacterium]
MDKPHFEILDKKRLRLLPLFKPFKNRFYLAGGTGLALQFAHRDSIDFDFFTEDEFITDDLLREARAVFADVKIEVAQAGNMTLNLIIADDVKVSFFCIKDKLLLPLLDFDPFNVASLDDIACMKIVALLRAAFKDYVDLYYLFKRKPLARVMENCRKKYPGFEEMVYLKALLSFDDIKMTNILFKRGWEVNLKEIRKSFTVIVKDYLQSNNF